MSFIEDLYKNKIQILFSQNPNIHMNVSLTKPRLKLENAPAKILGVYPSVFRIEECSTGKTKYHTLSYKDIITGEISIIELNEME